jgi:hypothetical protein
MSDNPYRFTVEVESSTWKYMDTGATAWWVVVRDMGDIIDDSVIEQGPFHIEAEAIEHAEFIRQAMREVS